VVVGPRLGSSTPGSVEKCPRSVEIGVWRSDAQTFDGIASQRGLVVRECACRDIRGHPGGDARHECSPTSCSTQIPICTYPRCVTHLSHVLLKLPLFAARKANTVRQSQVCRKIELLLQEPSANNGFGSSPTIRVINFPALHERICKDIVAGKSGTAGQQHTI